MRKISLVAARKAHALERKESGSCPAGWSKHDKSIIPSDVVMTKYMDPLYLIAPPSVASMIFLLSFILLYMSIAGCSSFMFE